MNNNRFISLARRLLSQPTAPYFEHEVRSEAEKICSEHCLPCCRDRYGNLLVHLQTAAGLRPLVLAAHLDHPGFEITGRIAPRRWLGRFRGRVPLSYFHQGIQVRLMPGAVPGTLGAIRDGKAPTVEVLARRDTGEQFDFAVWELDDFKIRNRRIYARACDDVVGAAAVLATLIELQKGQVRVNVVGVLSRAEEVGFHGALALAADSAGDGKKASKLSSSHGRCKAPGTACGLPPPSLVLSLETSRELPGVKMGAGVIIRVGDKVSVFDSEATRFLTEVATGLQRRRPSFFFQRALMGGGTCEATAYQEFGFQSAAVCVALGNYHNCGPDGQIRAEYVSVSDARGMVELLVESARCMSRYEQITGRLRQRLAKLLGQAKARLPERI